MTAEYPTMRPKHQNDYDNSVRSAALSATTDLADTRAAIAPLYLAAEKPVLLNLLDQARRTSDEDAAIAGHIGALVSKLRASGGVGLVERFMQEYDLVSDEGVALLSLAEAYLRIPDRETAGALVRDKIGAGDWAAHRGQSSSFVVNGATLGLVIARALHAPDASALTRLVARAGEGFVRTAVAAVMQMMGTQFVLGRTIDEGLKRARRGGWLCSFDMLGEAARTAEDAQRYFAAYAAAIEAAGQADVERPLMDRHSVSVKLSALHPRYEEAQRDVVVPILVEKVVHLARMAKAGGIGLTIDAEESERLELSLDIIEQVAAEPALQGWDGLGMAVQAYQKRASAVIDWANALGAAHGRRLAVRLVKGAYWDTEIKRAQEQGLDDYPVFTRKEATDVCYLACARRMLASDWIQPAFASHNILTLTTLMAMIGDRTDVEFQRLHGMGEGLADALFEQRSLRMRVYAPVGGYRDLLAYLVRRLLENGANSSFVHQLHGDKSIAELSVDPVALVERNRGRPHPLIPLPAAMLGADRRNSEGIALSDRQTLADLSDAMRSAWTGTLRAAPFVAGQAAIGPTRAVLNPADTDIVVGHVVEAREQDVERAIVSAGAAARLWSERPVGERADCLDRMADLLERDRDRLMGIAIAEAGKTIPDALAEIREAVDFCRYYANEARRLFAPMNLPGPTGEHNELTLAGRGVFACISPWNFPLAIFIGQVTAALVAGNAVVAKPAPQTPLIAQAAIDLLVEAGIPPEVIQFLPGGPEIGRVIVAHPAVQGVAFTGSTAAARHIARSLLEDDARPIVPLIAETGGLNAMIVDSTALPEQVVADVIVSAFQSAGQRCSALRLLCIQEEVAEPILEMLRGAASELRCGDPARIDTDVGPVIDAEARARIEAYVEESSSRIIYRRDTMGLGEGHFVAPTIIRLDRPEDLRREVFGPVLHVVTWPKGGLADLVDRINASGYGLTMGLHSRLAQAVDLVRSRAHVGNLYVNRSMIGAVVGVQPFGGEGLSGTGPKAGGPHYLLRFAAERAVSIDTTANGGNAKLLSLSPELDSEPV